MLFYDFFVNFIDTYVLLEYYSIILQNIRSDFYGEGGRIMDMYQKLSILAERKPDSAAGMTLHARQAEAAAAAARKESGPLCRRGAATPLLPTGAA